MFKTFIVDLENVEFIKHNCKSDMLQYNSGLCELFSVKFAFYRQRLAITAGYYGIDIVKDGFDKRFFRLFRNGLLESAFSKMENEKGTILKSFSNSYLEERINILKEQEENLLGINEMFSISKISEILLEDGQKSRKLIYELSDSENPFKPSIEDIASAINVDKTTNEKIKAFINIINNDPQLLFIKNDEVIEYGSKFLIAAYSVAPIIGFQFVFISTFQALGKALPSLVLSLSRQGIAFVPAIVIGTKFFGINGIIWAQPIADIVSIILAGIMYIYIYKTMKKKHALENNQEAAV